MKPLIMKALLLASAITAMSTATTPGMAADKKRPERGAVERQKSWHGDRASGTTTTTKTVDRDEKSWETHRSTVYENGKTSSTEINGQKTDDGVSINKTHTGPSGTTVTTDIDYSKTANGWTSTGTYETSTGKSGTISQVGTKTDTGRTVETTTTNSEGKTRTKVREYNK